MTFLGGSVVGLLVTDRASRPPRVTDDVDITIEVGSRMDYYTLESDLRDRGFINVIECPTCRFIHSGVVVDVMPTDSEFLAFQIAGTQLRFAPPIDMNCQMAWP